MNALNIATKLMREGQLAWHLFRDPRVSTLAKFIPALGLLYVLMPIDIIPDWIPIIGGVDDIAIASGAITLFIRVCNPDIVDEIMDKIEGV